MHQGLFSQSGLAAWEDGNCTATIAVLFIRTMDGEYQGAWYAGGSAHARQGLPRIRAPKG